MDPRAKTFTEDNENPADEPSTKNAVANFYTVKGIVEYEHRPTSTYYNVCWYGYKTQNDTVKPATHISHYFPDVFWQKFKAVTENIRARKTEETKREKTRIKKDGNRNGHSR